MRYKLEGCIGKDSNGVGVEWLELGIYPDRCRAEIMRSAHAKSGAGDWYTRLIVEGNGVELFTYYRITEVE